MIFLVKTDNLGNIKWNHSYGGDDMYYAYSVIETSDKGFALAGFRSSYEAGIEDFWLVRTDEYGIPEFPSWIILPLFTITALFVMVIKKKMLASII
jgi:hypothetical protein